jgi:peptidoglycan L-alanyl-D-glutamate endopeptidase CwlK
MKLRNKYNFGRSSTTRKKTVSKYLQLTADKAIKSSPVDFGVPWMGGKRTAEEQKDIFNKGYSRADGYNNLSYHQKVDEVGAGKAIDLVPYIPGVGFAYDAVGRFGIIGMLMLEAWEELQDEGKIPEKLHLHWGGFWRNREPKDLGWDLAHYEIRSAPQVERL